MVTVLPLAHEVISASADGLVEGMACGRLEMACAVNITSALVYART